MKAYLREKLLRLAAPSIVCFVKYQKSFRGSAKIECTTLIVQKQFTSKAKCKKSFQCVKLHDKSSVKACMNEIKRRFTLKIQRAVKSSVALKFQLTLKKLMINALESIFLASLCRSANNEHLTDSPPKPINAQTKKEKKS